MIRSGEVPGGISMRAKWTLTPSGTARGYHASTTMLTLGTMTPSRISALISCSQLRRHARESGYPGQPAALASLDSAFFGNDGEIEGSRLFVQPDVFVAVAV